MSGKNTAVFGVYPTHESADAAVDTLRTKGFRNTDISVLFPQNVGSKEFGHEKGTKSAEGAVAGGGTGAAIGGALGWLAAEDCAPEFAREIFGHAEIGVLPRLVHSRHGLHVVEVQARAPGVAPAFEAVRSAVANSLRQQGFVTALRQYLQVLAGAAIVEGVDLERTATPLVR